MGRTFRRAAEKGTRAACVSQEAFKAVSALDNTDQIKVTGKAKHLYGFAGPNRMIQFLFKWPTSLPIAC